MSAEAIHIDLQDCPGSAPDGFVVFVTDYECGCYEGSGWALGMKADGTKWEFDLGHCSCYGPLEDDRSSRYSPDESALSTGYLSSELVNQFDSACERWNTANASPASGDLR